MEIPTFCKGGDGNSLSTNFQLSQNIFDHSDLHDVDIDKLRKILCPNTALKILNAFKCFIYKLIDQV